MPPKSKMVRSTHTQDLKSLDIQKLEPGPSLERIKIDLSYCMDLFGQMVGN